MQINEYDAHTINDQRKEIKYLKERVDNLETQVSRLKSELSNEVRAKKVLGLLAESMQLLTK